MSSDGVDIDSPRTEYLLCEQSLFNFQRCFADFLQTADEPTTEVLGACFPECTEFE